MKKSALKKLASSYKANSSTVNLVKIGEASELIGVSIDTLRRWEKKGWLKVTKTPAGTRLYDKEQLIKLNPNLKRGPKSLLTPISPAKFSTPSISQNQPSSELQSYPISLSSDRHILRTSETIEQHQIDSDIHNSFASNPLSETSPVTTNTSGFPSFTSLTKFKSHLKTSLLTFILLIVLLLPINLLTNYFKQSQIASLASNNQAVKINDLAQALTNIFSPNLSHKFFGKNPPGSPPGNLSQKLKNNPNPASQRDLGYINGGDVLGSKSGSVLADATPSASFLQINLDTDINGLLDTTTLHVESTASVDGPLTLNGVTYTFPQTQGGSATVLQNNGQGSLSWTSIPLPVPATNTTLGIASFSSSNFTVTGGAVSITPGSITGTEIASGTVSNTNLSNSSITINTSGDLTGGGTVSLGGSLSLSVTSAAAGVTSITGTANQIIASSSTGDVTLSLPITFPLDSGTNGYVLTTDGAGNTSWTAQSGGIGGSGTANTITKFTAASTIGDSLLTDDGTTFAINTDKFTVTESSGNTNIAGSLTVGTTTTLNGITYTWPGSQSSGQVLTTNGSGTLSWTDPSSLTVRWNTIDNPDDNQSLAMSTYTSTWNWATGTGSNDLFSLTTDNSSNGTGSLLNIQTGTSSTILPLRIRSGSNEALTVTASGNVGIGNTNSSALFSVGSSSQFAVNSSGAITAATGISSSGTINFSTLSASAGVYTDSSKNLTSTPPSSGTIGYWSRTGTTLSPATAGDNVTTSGNISTSSSGTITSAGTLTASDGFTQTTGALNLTSTSGSISSTGLTALTYTLSSGTAAITAPTLNLNTSSTGNTAIGNATGTFALTSNGGLNVTTGGALTGVASIDTIAFNATTQTFAGAGTVTATSTGLNLQNDGSVDVNIAGGSSATGCTVENSTGNLTCTGTISGSGSVGFWSRTATTLSPVNAGDNVTTSGNISTSGSGTITSAGTLTASDGFTQTTGALNLTSTSGSINSTGLSAATISVTSGTLALATVTSGNITATTGAGTGLFNILTGNLKVGNGTPTLTQDGEDAYIEGTFEVDGISTFGGNVGIGTTDPTSKLYINASQTSGTISTLTYDSGTVLSGNLIGQAINLSAANLTATNQSVTGSSITIPTVTDTHTSGTKSLTGISIVTGNGSGINQNGSGGTLEFAGLDVTMPALTQTAGTLNAYGTRVTTPSTITTGGTAYGNYINAAGVGAGNLNGLGISSITGGSGTEYALNIGTGWDAVLRVGSTTVINGSGVTVEAGGGTGQSTYSTGDILYASGANTLAKRSIGSSNDVLTVIGGVPTWGPISGASCTNCLVNDPSADQYIAPTGQSTTGLTVRQTSTASPTDDIFQVTDSTGSTKYFWVDKDGNVSTSSTTGQTLTLTPLTDTTALTLVGTNVLTQPLQYINANNEEGNIFELNYGAAQTLTNSLTAFNIDLSTNITSTNQSVTGTHITLPGATNTHTTGTVNVTGFSVDGGALNQNGSGGTTVFAAFDATIPAITQTSGSMIAYGLNINTPSSITTNGTASALNVTATGIGAGTLYGLNISDITAGAGTEVGAQIGSGWDTNLLFNDTTTRVAVANGGTITILDTAGNSLCTITDSGSVGDLSCTGTISGGGSVGYWSRSVTTLSPVNAGDNVTTSGNISTSGSGTITSAGTLTASDGFTQTTGALNLTSTSGSISSTGLTALTYTLSSGTAAITAPTLNLNTSSTGNTAIGNATGTFALTSNGGLNVTTGGALTGVASLDTIAFNATTQTFAGAGTVTATSTGLNLQNDGSVNVNIAGGSSATGCTVENSTGNLTCTGTISGSGSVGFWSRTSTILSPSTANDVISVSSNDGTNPVLALTASGAPTTAASLSLTNTTGTQTNGLLINRNGAGGTTTNGLSITNSNGTLTNGINIGTGTQAITTALNIGSTGVTTDVSLQNGETIDNDTDGTINFGVSGTSAAKIGANGITSLGNVAHSIINSSGALNIDSNSTGAINIGTGANAKTITIGNSTGATALAFTSGTGSQTFTSSVATTSTTSSAFVFTANSLTTGTGAYINSTSITTGKLFQLSTGAANTLTSGTLADIRTTSTALTGTTGTGSLLNLDWSPGSATTATGDLFSLNIGSNGTTTGNLFNILDSSASIFSVSETAMTTSLPANFTAAGDVSIAYDINFTNPTASYIKSAAPLVVVAGETFNSSNLTLQTYNQGTIAFSTANTTTTALDFTNTTLTTGTGFNMTLGAFTTGTGLSINTSNNTHTTGTLLNVASSSTAQTSDTLLNVAQTGATTGVTGTTVAFSTSASTNSSAKLLTLTANSMTTGTIATLTGNALTSGTGLHLSSTTNGYTSGKLLNIDLTQTAATGTSVSGNLSAISFNPTYSTAVTSPAISGNVLNISRSATTNASFASTLTVSGALASFTDTATQTTGTITSTADVVRVNAGFSGNTGSALNIASSGANTGYLFRANDDGTFTDSTPFVIDNTGNVGIGNTSPSTFKLELTGSIGPSADDTYDLGSDTRRWRDIYLGGETIHLGTSTTDEGTISYNTTSNILNFGTDSTSNGNIAFFTSQLYLNKSSNLTGIGTTAPSQRFQVNANASNPVVITSGGNVGIGITDPNGSIAFPSSHLGDTLKINLYNASPQGFGTAANVLYAAVGSASDRFAIFDTPTRTNELFTVKGGGNIGISTNNPGSKLEVYMGSSSTGYVTINKAGSVANQTAGFAIFDANHGMFSGTNGSGTNFNELDFKEYGGVFKFINSNTSAELMRINNGNVGIGITLPANKLDVVASADATTYQLGLNNIDTTSSSLASTGIRFDMADTSGTEINAATIEAHKEATWTSTSSTRDGYLSFSTTLDSAGAEKMRITSSGNVGIGTTNPGAKLEVWGTSDSSLAAQFGGAGTPRIRLYGDQGAGSGAMIDFNTGNGGSLATANGSGAPIYIRPGNGVTAGTTFAYSGNVGIGTTNPGAKLEVNGSIIVSGCTGCGSGTSQWTTAGSNIYFTTGNVGIGTTSPLAKLNIQADQATNTNLTDGQLIISGNTNTNKRLNLGFDTTNNLGFIMAGESGVAWRSLALNPNGGNVGIGTTAPVTKLQVVDSGSTGASIEVVNSSTGISNIVGLSIYNTNSTTNNWAGFGMGDAGNFGTWASAIGTQITDHTNDYGDIGFATRSSGGFTEKMRITSTGNVGIGTSGPTAKFDLVGTNGSGGAAPLAFNVTGGVGATALGNSYAGGNITLTAGSGGNGVGSGGNGGAGGSITLNGGSGGSGSLGGSTGAYGNILLATAGGNVGIGTTLAPALLSVLKSSSDTSEAQQGFALYASTSDTKLQMGTVPSAYSYIQSMQYGTSWTNRPLLLQPNGGNVGIGTTGAATTLDVRATTPVLRLAYSADNFFPQFSSWNSGFANDNFSMGINTTDTSASTVTKPTSGYSSSRIRLYTTNALSPAINFEVAAHGSTSWNTAMVVRSDGNVGIGLTNPSTKLEVSGSRTDGTGIIRAVNSGTSGTPFTLELEANGSNGSGTNTAIWARAVNGGTNYSIQATGNILLNGTGGTCTLTGGTTGGAAVCSSDQRLKENITSLDGSTLTRLMQLRPVTYNLKDKNKDQSLQTGLIAQEVQTIFPEFVRQMQDGYYGVNYQGFIVPTIKAVQELNSKVDNALLTLNPNGTAQSINAQKITVAEDIKVGGLVTAKGFTLDATSINRVGSLANIPVNNENKVSVADAINAINSQQSAISNQVLGLESQNASNSAQISQVEQLSNRAIEQSQSLDQKVATTSANLASLSDKINNLLASISGNTQNNSETGNQNSGVSYNLTSGNPSPSEFSENNLTPPNLLIATDSANIAKLNVTESLSSLRLSTLDATISGTLKSLGETFLGKTTIAGDFSVDATLSLTGDSINSIACGTRGTRDTCGTLFLQNSPLAQAVDFFNGKITLTKDGLLSTESLALGDQSLGQSIIKAGQTEVTIPTSLITPTSRIFLTPTSPVQGNLYPDKIIPGENFKVKLSTPNPTDIKFNWLIVQTK